ncbi:ABC transporter permease [Actinomadura citrea]|jgi:NitT/TauT family transport system permease protein|uniref:NitT/TauT family transport system permease protein n=1 Tax=Actinomadura citrea TaxID=46158 RepID=A0A7Y9G7H7_9ACTN|nr:ABC transporter permease subunit [Actinomadura citrea]NYE11309.1 NitT/TauT family transport system permease protein [Actinomadura citrea]GGT77229.1 sulfate ABC transporter permease [Actinomadura citrea]
MAHDTVKGEARLDRELAGLDALELGGTTRARLLQRAWSAVWPMIAAVLIALAAWQLVVWSGWKEPWVLPGPRETLPVFWDQLTSARFWEAVALTMRRAVVGFAFAVAVGVVVGALVARFRVLRRAFGSLITGLQTMPSIAWFPLAILLFRLSESAILFVVILGAAPSIANGLIAGVDYTPPILLRAGKVMGLRGLALYRHLIMPASLPSFVAGLKQGWAFAWRSLMAGELLVIIGDTTSLGVLLSQARELNNTADMISYMLMILILGIVIDQLFGLVDGAIRRRWGLDEGSS